VKALAILSKNRSPSMPGLASAHEQGLTDFDVPSWYAIFLPKGTPAAIVQKLHDATVAAMGVSLIRERLKEIGCDLVPPERSSPEYLRKFVAGEIDKWAAAIKVSGVQID
jgi:tripartite-type tricarboxylate transporter receptor subunit TctC